MENLYIAWNAKSVEISNGNVQSWKRCSEVCHMLEHVAGSHTIVYIQKLLTEGIPKQIIQDYAKLCDSVGDPYVYTFEGIQTSTTCIRYLYHALQIVNMNAEMPLHIVEIGGGYGGLALAVDFISKFKNVTIPKYSIVDLPSVQELQKFYLNKFELSFDVKFSISVSSPFFLVSNYALSEMSSEYRNVYIKTMILPHAHMGFLVWNSGDGYEELVREFNCNIEKEDPQTGPDNVVIVFRKNNGN